MVGPAVVAGLCVQHLSREGGLVVQRVAVGLIEGMLIVGVAAHHLHAVRYHQRARGQHLLGSARHHLLIGAADGVVGAFGHLHDDVLHVGEVLVWNRNHPHLLHSAVQVNLLVGGCHGTRHLHELGGKNFCAGIQVILQSSGGIEDMLKLHSASRIVVGLARGQAATAWAHIVNGTQFAVVGTFGVEGYQFIARLDLLCSVELVGTDIYLAVLNTVGVNHVVDRQLHCGHTPVDELGFNLCIIPIAFSLEDVFQGASKILGTRIDTEVVVEGEAEVVHCTGIACVITFVIKVGGKWRVGSRWGYAVEERVSYAIVATGRVVVDILFVDILGECNFVLNVAVNERIDRIDVNVCVITFAYGHTRITIYYGVSNEQVWIGTCGYGYSTAIFVPSFYQSTFIIGDSVVKEAPHAEAHAAGRTMRVVVGKERVEARALVHKHTAGKDLFLVCIRSYFSVCRGVTQHKATLNRGVGTIAEDARTLYTFATCYIVDDDTVT